MVMITNVGIILIKLKSVKQQMHEHIYKYNYIRIYMCVCVYVLKEIRKDLLPQYYGKKRGMCRLIYGTKLQSLMDIKFILTQNLLSILCYR